MGRGLQGSVQSPLRQSLHPIAQSAHAFSFGAVFAAEDGSCSLQAVTNDAGTAMRAGWRKRMDRTLKAIEGMGFATLDYLKCLVIVVSASLAYAYDITSLS